MPQKREENVPVRSPRENVNDISLRGVIAAVPRNASKIPKRRGRSRKRKDVRMGIRSGGWNYTGNQATNL